MHISGAQVSLTITLGIPEFMYCTAKIRQIDYEKLNDFDNLLCLTTSDT